MTTILKSTTKGQITIPAQWRKKFNTDRFVATIKDDRLEIKPLIITENKEMTVFDAIRDNKGKGIKAKDLARLIQKTLQEDGQD